MSKLQAVDAFVEMGGGMDTQQPMVDEISLMDIALILKKRKKLFWGVVGLFVCVAVVVSVLKSSHYEFSQKFRIAHYYSASLIAPVFSLSGVLIELNTQVIPDVLARYNQKNSQHLMPLVFSASPVGYNDAKLAARISSDKSSGDFIGSDTLIQLNAKGKKSMLPAYQQLFTEMYQQLVQRELIRVDYFKKALNFQLNLDQGALADYQRDFVSLDLKLTKHPLVKDKATGQPVAVNSETVGVESLARIQELMTYRQMLSYRMTIHNKIESLKRAIQNKQFNLSTLSELKPVAAITASIGAVGLAKRTLFLLVCVFGFFIALMAVFLAEFRQKLKQQDAQ